MASALGVPWGEPPCPRICRVRHRRPASNKTCLHGAARLRACLLRQARWSPAAPTIRNISPRRRRPSLRQVNRHRCHNDRDGRGQGRSHPAIVGARQCRHRRPGHAQRRGNGTRGIQRSQYISARQRRWRHRGSGADRCTTGARPGRGNHSRAAVRAIGDLRRSGGARAQCAGHRLFDRCQCRGEWRLSAEFPAGIRRRPHRAIRDIDR